VIYTKLAADGSDLPADATGHQAVRIEHSMLVLPIIVAAMKAPSEMNWEDAKKWAESLTINGWSWRLPTVEEAMFIPDRSKYPAVDKNFFPDFEEYEWIWTSTVDAEDPSDYAWLVYLRRGHVNRNGQTNHGYVRAVRAGQ
jgi:Protein of unknown function (DUF1566)